MAIQGNLGLISPPTVFKGTEHLFSKFFLGLLCFSRPCLLTDGFNHSGKLFPNLFHETRKDILDFVDLDHHML